MITLSDNQVKIAFSTINTFLIAMTCLLAQGNWSHIMVGVFLCCLSWPIQLAYEGKLLSALKIKTRE